MGSSQSLALARDLDAPAVAPRISRNSEPCGWLLVYRAFVFLVVCSQVVATVTDCFQFIRSHRKEMLPSGKAPVIRSRIRVGTG